VTVSIGSGQRSKAEGSPSRNRVLLTGGGGDIGGAVAQLLSDRGDEIVRLGHDPESRPDYVADFTNDQSLMTAISSIPGTFSHVVLAHGVIERRSLPELDVEAWHRVLDVNLTSVFVILHALAPRIGDIRSIVVVSSTAGLDRSRNGGAHYTVSKAALNALVRHLAQELGPRGVRINAVCPGTIEGRMSSAINSPETMAAASSNIALRRIGKPIEVADVIAFLLSDESSFVTGALVSVAGGTHR
jgi:3-oxoacyl-[acyl-carrier protein] reductase